MMKIPPLSRSARCLAVFLLALLLPLGRLSAVAAPPIVSTPTASVGAASAKAILGVYNVKAFGAKGDGTTDDSGAIQAAINAASTAGGGIVWFPTGTYKVTQAGTLGGRAYCLRLGGHSVTLMGAGLSSRIACNTAGADTVLVRLNTGDTKPAAGPVIEKLYFNPLTQKSNGAFEVYVPYSRRFTLRDVRFGEGGTLPSSGPSLPAADPTSMASLLGSCIKIGGNGPPSGAAANSTVLLTNVTAFDFQTFLDCRDTVDIRITDCETDAKRGAAQTLYFGAGTEAVQMSGCDFVNTAGIGPGSTASCMVLDGVRFSTFTNSYFDTHLNGVEMRNAQGVTFVNCWASVIGSGRGFWCNPQGANDAVSDILISGSRCVGNIGVAVDGGRAIQVQQTTVLGGGGTGISVGAAAVDWTVADCLVWSLTGGEALASRLGTGTRTGSVVIDGSAGLGNATNNRYRTGGTTTRITDVVRN